jgi:hypothetical protein
MHVLVSYRQQVGSAYERCILLNKDCSVAILVQSMQRGGGGGTKTEVV